MNIDASLLVIMVAFWATYWIVRTFLIKPIVAVLDERQGAVESAQATYDDALAETNARIEAERARLVEARQAARVAREQARKAARDERMELLQSARQEAEQRLEAARAELDREVEAARSALSGQARELADRMTEQLLRRAS